MKRSSYRKLKATTIPIGKVTTTNIEDMFKLYEKYYDNISKSQFTKDLKNKNKVILLKNAEGSICGFSTLAYFHLNDHPKRPYCIYSGDTIIHQDYWGSSKLTMEFLKNILLTKLIHPFSPVWWFLISKGYRTYLLLANNFNEYYPKIDSPTPQDKLDIVEALSNKVYPNRFDRKTGIISFKDCVHEKLKPYVAPITEGMCQKNEKINFFQNSNPNWRDGEELACLGKISFILGVLHPYKIFKKKYLSKIFKTSKNKLWVKE